MKKQLHAYYIGRVQGVGFRWTAQDIARQLNINGWARNLVDGKVEVLIEAEESDLKQFLEQIRHSFSTYIERVDTDWQEATGEFDGFRIEF